MGESNEKDLPDSSLSMNKLNFHHNVHPIIQTLVKNKNCELLLKLNPSPRENFTFTNYDILRGELIFNNRQPNSHIIVDISLSLEGYSKSSIPDQLIATDFNKQLYGNPSITTNSVLNTPSDDESGVIENPLLKQTNINFLQYHMNVECHKLIHEETLLYSIYDEDGSLRDNLIFTSNDHRKPFSILIPSEAFCCTGKETHEPDTNHNKLAFENTGNTSGKLDNGIFHIDPLNNTKIRGIVGHKKNLFINNKKDGNVFFDNEKKTLQYHLPPTLHNAGANIYDVVYFLKATITMVPRKYIFDSSLTGSSKTFGFRKPKKTENTPNLINNTNSLEMLKDKQIKYHGYREINFLPRENSVDISKREGKLDCLILTKCKLFDIDKNIEIKDSSIVSDTNVFKSSLSQEILISGKSPKMEQDPNDTLKLEKIEALNGLPQQETYESLKQINPKDNLFSVLRSSSKGIKQDKVPRKKGKIIINRSSAIERKLEKNRSFWLELRFTESDYFTPSTTPHFKLFIVSDKDPDLMNMEANLSSTDEKLGYININSIDIDLIEFTILKNQTFFDKIKLQPSSKPKPAKSSKPSNNVQSGKLRSSKQGNLGSINDSTMKSKQVDDCLENQAERDFKFIKNHYTRTMNILKTSPKFSHRVYLTSEQKLPNISKKLTVYNSFVKNTLLNATSSTGSLFEAEIPLCEFDNISVNAANHGFPGYLIPSDLAPSFTSCNLKRDYKFVVKFGYSIYACEQQILYLKNNEIMDTKSNKANQKSKSKNGNDNLSGIDRSTRKATLATKIKILSGISNLIEDHVISMNSLNSYPDLPSYEEIFG